MIRLDLSLEPEDQVQAARHLIRMGFAPLGAPSELSVNDRPAAPSAQWLDLPFENSLVARFATGKIGLHTSRAMRVDVDVETLTPFAFMGAMTQVHFTIGASSVFDSIWSHQKYRRPSFDKLHVAQGFACFFQAEGHRRLVSRRWLDYGPWRLLRGENDTTMVQFHDLDADADTALKQAHPGHEHMGMSYTGGFLWPTMTFRILKSWLYDRASKKVTVLINRREIEPGELLEAATMRAFQTLGPDQPIERVAYVFVHPDEAQQHLHELWLRELECWTFTPKGQEIRLDLDYQPPPPVKPEWVQHVEAREAE